MFSLLLKKLIFDFYLQLLLFVFVFQHQIQLLYSFFVQFIDGCGFNDMLDKSEIFKID